MLATAVFAMGALATVLSALLVVASQRLSVEEDERLESVLAALPGNNCGACGQPGCRGFAEALLAGQAKPAECTVSSSEQRVRLADMIGIEVGEATRRVARLACAGGSNVARMRAHYVGEPSCAAASLISGGGKGCVWGCLGYGDCVQSCDFAAIGLDTHQLPVVDQDACTACGDCIDACPKDLFSLEPIGERLWVACRNGEAGDALLDDCQVACTACGRCALDAPDVVSMVGNLPVVAASQAPTRNATERCPTGAIVWLDGGGRPHRGRDASAIVRDAARQAGTT